MNTLHVKYLLVGGGLASSAAAEEIRRRDPSGSVLLVAQEIHRPYHRPALSHDFFTRENARADLSTFPLGWFTEHNIELQTGRRVEHIDTARSVAALNNGQEVSFDKMLLAIGASPNPLKIPGADLPNFLYLRTIEDANRLQNAIDKALHEGHRHPIGVGRGLVTVIGAGLLGVELAASLAHAGLHVDLIAGHPHPWFRIAGEATGAFLARHLKQNGVVVHTDHRAHRLEGDGRVQRVVLDSGEAVQCDFAVGAAGMRINRELLRNTPIAAETAILVDQRCETSVPNIFAAGDCAAVYDPLFDKHRVVDHWENAMITGAIAGANMAGGDEKFEVVSHYVSEVFGVQFSIWGERRMVHHRLVRGTPNARGQFVEFGIDAEGRVAQVINVGSGVEDSHLLMRCVASRMQTSGIEEMLKDPTQPLATLVE